MNKHTPGPWGIVNPGLAEIYCTVHGANGGGICAIGAGSTENHHFNARLIAAAPDLFAALEDLVICPAFNGQVFSNDKESHRAWTIARAAIAKARGD